MRTHVFSLSQGLANEVLKPFGLRGSEPELEQQLQSESSAKFVVWDLVGDSLLVSACNPHTIHSQFTNRRPLNGRKCSLCRHTDISSSALLLVALSLCCRLQRAPSP